MKAIEKMTIKKIIKTQNDFEDIPRVEEREEDKKIREQIISLLENDEENNYPYEKKEFFEMLQDTDRDEVFESIEKIKIKEITKEILKTNILDKKEKFVLIEYFGLEGDPKTLREIGKILRISAEGVRQKIGRSLIKIRRSLYRTEKSDFSVKIFDYTDEKTKEKFLK